MKQAVRIFAALAAVAALSACESNGKPFPRFQFTGGLGLNGPVIRQPVVPEMLVTCRGHVLVPALGMTLVPAGHTPPGEGQYLREERIPAPYRIIPPGAIVSKDLSAARLNIEVDSSNRLIGLYCG